MSKIKLSSGAFSTEQTGVKLINTTSKPVQTSAQQPDTLYGLDIELLRDLNLDEFIDQKKKDQELQQIEDSQKQDDMMNMTMD